MPIGPQEGGIPADFAAVNPNDLLTKDISELRHLVVHKRDKNEGKKERTRGRQTDKVRCSRVA